MQATSLVLLLWLAAARGDSVVVSTPAPANQAPAPANSSSQAGKPDVYSLHITSHIQHRYARTEVSSRVANRAGTPQEIFFSFVMPDTAFISGFLMEIDGVEYKAHVGEKEAAKREYQEAVSQGRAAAHVAQSARNSNRFTVSVNIEPLKKVNFKLTYEELLKRQLSFYTHAINIDPGQIIRDLSVEVYINESSPIRNLQVPVLKETNEIDPQGYSEEDPYAVIEVTSLNTATVRWAPTEKQQVELKAEGIKGQLVVRYDLNRTAYPEQILVNEGYFVHFFSPDELVPLPKHVIFVIDVSGSMYGRKIEQVRDAMTRILSDLSPADFFSFITFSTEVKVWDLEHPLAVQHTNRFDDTSDETALKNSSVVAGTSDNINKAKEFVHRLETYASTNIHGALMKALKVAQLGREITHGKPEPMIIFLTDGDANVGESNPGRIAATVTDENVGGVSIFSLAFGDYADLDFLKKLSLKNSGFARKIYEASDAALQLQDFYRQISSPLLANVTFEYTENQVEEESISTTKFSTLFRGSELVVAGKLRSSSVTGVVKARGVNGTYTLDSSPAIFLEHIHHNSTASSMERLWGYLTIQQLLERETAGDGNSSAIRERALNLALRYSFVTSLTSLVVVKPNETTSAGLEGGDSARNEGIYVPGGAPPSLHAPMYFPRTAVGGYIPSSYPSAPGPLVVSGLQVRGPVSVSSPMLDVVEDSVDMNIVLTTTQKSVVKPDPQIVPLSSLTWVSRTDNSSTITLQDNPASSPEVLLVRTTNETNEAFAACNTTLGGPGHCRHLFNCALDVFQDSIFDYFPFLCRINNYAGVCCPDSLQPVVVQS